MGGRYKYRGGSGRGCPDPSFFASIDRPIGIKTKSTTEYVHITRNATEDHKTLQIRCTADKIQTGMDHPYLSDQDPYSGDPNAGRYKALYTSTS